MLPTGVCELSRSVVSDVCEPMDCSPPGSSVHGILPARTLEWVAIPFFRGSSQPRTEASPALQADSSPAELPEKLLPASH